MTDEIRRSLLLWGSYLNFWWFAKIVFSYINANISISYIWDFFLSDQHCEGHPGHYTERPAQGEQRGEGGGDERSDRIQVWNFYFFKCNFENARGKNMCFILLQDCRRHAQEATKVRELTTMDIESKFAKRPVPVDIFFWIWENTFLLSIF